MNPDKLYEKLPNLIVGGGIIAGLAGAADTLTSQKYGTDLGLRGMLPEPINVADHGMSWAAGAVFSQHSYQKALDTSGEFKNSIDTLTNPAVTPKETRLSIRGAKAAVAGAVMAGVIAGSSYVVMGEVGSEVVHAVHNSRQQDKPETEKKPLPLGHLDPLDLLYGVGAAVAVAKLKGRKVNNILNDMELALPPAKEPTKTQPTANKRYTPPKKK